MSAKVIYNGQTFLDIVVGQVVTLVCSGKRMSSDVEIRFYEDGTVSCNGAIIDVVAGQRAILHCKDKLMTDDIVVHLPDNLYQTLITVDGHTYTTYDEQIFKVLES